MGRQNWSLSDRSEVSQGAWKILLDENQLPDHATLIDEIRSTHAQGRGLAFHCVTRAELVFAASVLEAAGCTPLDRIEHASIAPPDCVEWLARLPLTVVTQPNFIQERGDAYLESVEDRDQPWLYRCRGFLKAGVRLAGSTDAPFGDPNPWLAMQSAIDRRTRRGDQLGPEEAISPEEALALFSSPLDAPGQHPGPFRSGEPANLCLLKQKWALARDQNGPSAGRCRLDSREACRSRGLTYTVGRTTRVSTGRELALVGSFSETDGSRHRNHVAIPSGRPSSLGHLSRERSSGRRLWRLHRRSGGS